MVIHSMVKVFDSTFLAVTIADTMRSWAASGHYDGWVDRTGHYASQCTALHLSTGTRLMFTRDVGMHSSGWWKNPDYERCWHLSLSFCEPSTIILRDQYPKGVRPGNVFMAKVAATGVGRDKNLSRMWTDAFFRADTRLLWVESPYSPEGKAADVWHYRLFCAPNWTPILPRGEVYSKEFTEMGWKSFSDVMAAEGEAAELTAERLADASKHQAAE